MNPDASNSKTFEIEFREKRYDCNRIEKNGMLLYRVLFGQSGLYLSRGLGADGKLFWTSIPADPKLKHVVSELGEIIEKQIKKI